MLNILSGAISEKQIKKFYVDEIKDNFIDLDELNLKLLKSSMSIDKNKSIYKCVSTDRFYCSQFSSSTLLLSFSSVMDYCSYSVSWLSNCSKD